MSSGTNSKLSFPRPRFLRLYAAPLDGEARRQSPGGPDFHDATEAQQKTFEAIESERIQALTLLAASVAHEIGNPLNALHIHLQLMEREMRKLKNEDSTQERPSPPQPSAVAASKIRKRSMVRGAGNRRKLEHYLNVAKGEINRLDYIVTQFLQAIRPTPPQIKPTSLNEVVERRSDPAPARIGKPRASGKEPNSARQLPQRRSITAQMQQVLVNLIKNAMQAMSRGGILTLQTGEGADGVWFSISDTGGGIPQEQVNRIFEPFYTTKKKGTGLGLMIVQRIVRAHGGQIELESHVGHGTTFKIWLPMQERQPRLLEAAPLDEAS